MMQYDIYFQTIELFLLKGKFLKTSEETLNDDCDNNAGWILRGLSCFQLHCKEVQQSSNGLILLHCSSLYVF